MVIRHSRTFCFRWCSLSLRVYWRLTWCESRFVPPSPQLFFQTRAKFKRPVQTINEVQGVLKWLKEDLKRYEEKRLKSVDIHWKNPEKFPKNPDFTHHTVHLATWKLKLETPAGTNKRSNRLSVRVDCLAIQILLFLLLLFIGGHVDYYSYGQRPSSSVDGWYCMNDMPIWWSYDNRGRMWPEFTEICLTRWGKTPEKPQPGN